MDETEYLECPCCGDEGALPDEDGYYYDGQILVCGCSGAISVTEDDVYISLWDTECSPTARCHGA